MSLPTRKTNLEHTFWQAIIFRLKTCVLQSQRAWRNCLAPVSRHQPCQRAAARSLLLGESRSRLWDPGNARERRLQAGKVENLRIGVRSINDVTISAGSIFSFWRQLGRPVSRRGYVIGRELREGCLIPSVGGGLCQLSNALYDCALQAGAEIVERHAHTQVIPGSLAEEGRDATVFWNYVDLRFRPAEDWQIEATLDADYLHVRFHGSRRVMVDEKKQEPPLAGTAPASCASCKMLSCFRCLENEAQPSGELTAVLVDDYWPEFDKWLQNAPAGRRVLFMPLAGKRFGIARYGWSTDGFVQWRHFPFFTALRSQTSRRLATQGADRQKMLLRQDEKLAKLYANKLTFEMTHLVVTQSLLPFLWRAGVLGGRTFEVLLTRWPLDVLQAKLETAHRLHRESRTLADFRAPLGLQEAEQTALAAALQVVTPHPALAALFKKAVQIPWEIPFAEQLPRQSNKVVFPASSLGRKGIYELREVLREHPFELIVTGPILENPHFWEGLQVRKASLDWWDEACMIVLPSFVENRPRILLEAIARGIPVIATPECGVSHLPGVITVPAGDSNTLKAAIENVLLGSVNSRLNETSQNCGAQTLS